MMDRDRTRPFLIRYWWRRLMLLLATLILAACVPTDSGIEGRLTAGPSCPVMRQDVPCPDQPYAGTLTIRSAATGMVVAHVSADTAGNYRVALSPGTYVIVPESPGVLPRAAEVIVTVLAHRFTRQDIVYDTGIR